RETFLRVYQSQKLLVKLRFMGKVLVGRSCYHALETKLEHVEPAKLFTYQERGEKDKKNKPKRGGGPKTGGKPKQSDTNTPSPYAKKTGAKRGGSQSKKQAERVSERGHVQGDSRTVASDSRTAMPSDSRTVPSDSRRGAPTTDPRTAIPSDSRTVPNDSRTAPMTDPRRITPPTDPRNAPTAPSSSVTPASSVSSRRTRKRR
ncbi:MAG: hypothetical protein RSD76_08045, partial [Clostridia bacterium]